MLSVLWCSVFVMSKAQDNPLPPLPPVFNGFCDTIVGKIGDEFSVTPAGQVAYEIPIKVPTGVGGMEPKLSITYNGSTRNGLCGVGFDLTGLSVINRAPSNLFNDGEVGAVEVNADDHFMLDGQRLIKIQDLGDGRAEYRTELNTFARIISEESDTLGPSRFIVQTKSGLTFEYDASQSPKANRDNPNGTNRTHFLFWLLQKVTDRSGNFYVVNYETSIAGDEYWPVSVNYTGHTTHRPDINTNPPQSVRLSYTNNSDSTVSYVGGLKVKSSKLLQYVDVYSSSQIVKRYALNYQSVNGRSQLVRVSEEDGHEGDMSCLPPTTFTWYNVDESQSGLNGFSDLMYHKGGRMTVGDFNGDGVSDVFLYTQESGVGWSGWRVYQGDGSHIHYSDSGQFYMPEVKQAFSGDLNGDGLDDIVFRRYHKNSGDNTGYNNCELYLAQQDTLRQSCQLEPALQTPFLTIQRDCSLYRIRHTGDGTSSVLVCFDNSKEARVYGYGGAGYMHHVTSAISPVAKWGNVQIGDLNGDGLDDIVNLSGSTFEVLFSQGQNAPFRNLQIGINGNYITRYLLGDFNGDGKCDCYFVTNYGMQAILYFKGADRFQVAARSSLEHIPFDSSRVIPADINGDGKEDFYILPENSPSSPVPYKYINVRDGKSFVPSDETIDIACHDHDFCIGDFNGDGKLDLLAKADKSLINQRSDIFYARNGLNCLLASITDGMGQQTVIEYKYMTDSTVHTQGHDVSGELRSFTTPWPLVSKVRTSDGIGGMRSTTYHYNNALLHKRGRGVLGFESVTVRDEATNTETFTRYELNTQVMQLAEVERRTTVNGRLVEETLLENSVTTYNGNSQIFTLDPVSVTTTKYEYNTGELTSQVTVETEHDNHGNVTRMVTTTGDFTVTSVNTYTDNESDWQLGRLTRSAVTHSNSNDTTTRVSTFEYDSLTGLLKKENLMPGHTTLHRNKEYFRDDFGNIIRSRDSCYIMPGRPVATQWSEDGRFIVCTTNALGHTSSTEWDAELGVPLRQTDANGMTTRCWYDNFGNVTRQSSPLDSVNIVRAWVKATTADAPALAVAYTLTTSPGKPFEQVFIDKLGRRLRTVTQGMDGRKIFSDVEYNHLGQVARASDPYFGGDAVYWHTMTYDAMGRTVATTAPDGTSVTVQYDGLTTTTIDQLGRRTRRTTDMEGRLVESEDDLGGLVQYSYDAAGNCVRVAGPRTVVTAQFDILGQRTQLVDSDLGTIEYTYNPYGELKSQTTNEQTVTYTRDKLGRITSETRPEMTVTNIYDTEWKGAISISKAMNGDVLQHKLDYSYDDKGRVTRELETIGSRSFSTQFAYNDLNQLAYITYPNGASVRNWYTETGYLWRVRHPGHGKLYWQADSMNARGQLEVATLGNGLKVRSAFDPLTGRVSRITTHGITDWQYTFNETGSLTSRRDVSRNKTESFEYDNLDRLIGVYHGDSLAQAMTYDAAGNLRSKTGVAEVIEYFDGTNRVKRAYGSGYRPVPWDNVTYSSFNKVTHLSSGDNTLDLLYGTDLSRVRATTVQNGVTAERYYVGRYYELEVRGDTLRPTCYIYGSEGVVALIENTNNYGGPALYLHKDHLGSVIAYSNQNGQLAQELSYDAWGRRRSADTWRYFDALTDAGALHPRGFTGHEHVDLMELVNMDGRMYDPVLGRFLSPDPFVQAPDFSQGLNRYAYCMNNPLSLTDPTGYSWLSKNWKSLVTAVVGIATAAILQNFTALHFIINGIIAGAATSFVNSVVNGANVLQIAKNTLIGGIQGGLSAGLNKWAGDGVSFFDKMFRHALVGGGLETVNGGKIEHGIFMGVINYTSGEAVDWFGNRNEVGWAGELAITSVIGGTIDELGGGNFANGATTAAFDFLFNQQLHNELYVKDESLVEPLLALSMALAVDDISGVGAFDDILIPFVWTVAGIAFVYEQYNKPQTDFIHVMESHSGNKQSTGGYHRGSSKRQKHEKQYQSKKSHKRFNRTDKKKKSEERRNKGKTIN